MSTAHDPPPLTPLGERLEDERRERGLTRKSAAKNAGVDPGRWAQVVTGGVSRGDGQLAATRPSARVVVLMADAVGVHPAEALRLAASREPEDPAYQALEEAAWLWDPVEPAECQVLAAHLRHGLTYSSVEGFLQTTRAMQTTHAMQAEPPSNAAASAVTARPQSTRRARAARPEPA